MAPAPEITRPRAGQRNDGAPPLSVGLSGVATAALAGGLTTATCCSGCTGLGAGATGATLVGDTTATVSCLGAGGGTCAAMVFSACFSAGLSAIFSAIRFGGSGGA